MPRRTPTPVCGWMLAFPARPRESTHLTGFEDTEALPAARAGGLRRLRRPGPPTIQSWRSCETVRGPQHGQLDRRQGHHRGEDRQPGWQDRPPDDADVALQG